MNDPQCNITLREFAVPREQSTRSLLVFVLGVTSYRSARSADLAKGRPTIEVSFCSGSSVTVTALARLPPKQTGAASGQRRMSLTLRASLNCLSDLTSLQKSVPKTHGAGWGEFGTGRSWQGRSLLLDAPRVAKNWCRNQSPPDSCFRPTVPRAKSNSVYRVKHGRPSR